MSKQCQECGDSFYGRIDKKFCSDTCRNAHNNRIKGQRSTYYRDVNSALRKNYKILEELIPVDRCEASKSKLIQKGFNFGYYTNVYTTNEGESYYYCYEYGYHPLENDQYVLLKKKDVDEK